MVTLIKDHPQQLAPVCGKCGAVKVRSDRTKPWRCSPCGVAAAKRLRTVEPGTEKVVVLGAKERLAQRLASMSDDELAERLSHLLKRNIGFGAKYPDRHPVSVKIAS